MSGTQEAEYLSPYGRIVIHVRGGKLTGVRLCPAEGSSSCADVHRVVPPEAAGSLDALRRYFEGEDVRVAASALGLPGASSFQRRVYAELMNVRFGEVVTYGTLAARVGSRGAARAVGAAMGRNPLPIFIPCHRVVAAGGRLGGFGAGLEWKSSLLRHEGWTVKEGMVVKNKASRDTPRACVYAGSFDPPTEGHMYMIKTGAELFHRLIVAVGVNPNKSYTFSVAERLEMLRECTTGIDNVEVDSFEGKFLVRYAESQGAGYILRGIRTLDDYRFEHAMRNVNEDMAPGITTVFLIPPREICEVSSSFVRGLVGFEGWQETVKPYVPKSVYDRLLGSDIRRPEQGSEAEDGPD